MRKTIGQINISGIILLPLLLFVKRLIARTILRMFWVPFFGELYRFTSLKSQPSVVCYIVFYPTSVVPLALNRWRVRVGKGLQVFNKHNFNELSISQNRNISTHRYYICKAMRFANVILGSFEEYVRFIFLFTT